MLEAHIHDSLGSTYYGGLVPTRLTKDIEAKYSNRRHLCEEKAIKFLLILLPCGSLSRQYVAFNIIENMTVDYSLTIMVTKSLKLNYFATPST